MKKMAALLCFACFSAWSFACTTFLLSDNGQFYFGRNYDWITGNGMVMTNARDMKKFSATNGSNLSWVSKYGSITFNQYGKEFPTGGMNEKGLVVELMWLDETKYPKEDSRPAMNVLQWIQYQLDNCQTIGEVIATDKKVRINATGTPLHYLIADASGNAATVEFLDGKMVVHKGKDLSVPVLTNSTYAESVQKTSAAVRSNKPASFSDNSIQRFAQACAMINTFNGKQKNAVDYSFSILDKVSQGNYTRWSIVYDISGKKIHFITDKNKSRRSVAFADFNFSCSGPPMAVDMNLADTGNLSKEFKKLSFEANKNLVETSAKQSMPRIEISESAIKETTELYHKISCTKKE
jgi:choloylglycine hydrolase